jgi:hypothetical protein
MNVIEWVLQGDESLVYLVHKNLLKTNQEELQSLQSKLLDRGIANFIYNQKDEKTDLWGNGIYSPKYTSTHYTLWELCQLGVDLSDIRLSNSIAKLTEEMWKPLGKVRAYRHQDLCVVAMILKIRLEAKINDDINREMIDYIIEHQMKDGGFNCAWERKPFPKQSSLHTTVSVLDAFATCSENNNLYRSGEIEIASKQCIEYILTKRLFRSVSTGNIIHEDMLKYPFPYGWKYDIMRALFLMSYFDYAYDHRMNEALNILIQGADDYGRVKAFSLTAGKHNLIYTRRNNYCRFNTYRFLYIIKTYRHNKYQKYISGDFI